MCKKKGKNRLFLPIFASGGDNEIRTRDLRVANATLYQLSHTPVVQEEKSSREFLPPPFCFAYPKDGLLPVLPKTHSFTIGIDLQNA